MYGKFNFKIGDIIIYCDEEFEVLNNYGDSGRVKDTEGNIISNFYWEIYGELCYKKYN